MAALRELPFGRYYGGVDTTPLVRHLAGAYADRTGDMALHRQAVAVAAAPPWPGWTDEASRRRRLRHLSTRRRVRPRQPGLEGQLRFGLPRRRPHPEGPIALVEVQGYVFAAFRGLAALAGRRGDTERADHWAATAPRPCAPPSSAISGWTIWASMRLAIDGDGEPCQVRTSNPGHLLYVGLPAPERAQMVSRSAAFRVASTRAGASARWPTMRCASTRCPTTTVRSGRTTPPCAAPAWRAMASATAWSG